MSSQSGSHTRRSIPSPDGLSATATTLNTASRRLNEAVGQLNAALKQLNLGISVWIPTFTKDGDPNQVSEYEELGYAKVKGTWGISIRQTLEGIGPDAEEREWHFDDAPREMRIRGAAFLHHLVARLNEDAHQKAQEIVAHASDVEQLASTISSIAAVSRGKDTLVTKGGQ